MRVRTILTIAILFATLVPTLLYGLWSYNNGVRREFSEVKDQHLLIAENLGYAMERYYTDLSAAFDSISAAMVKGRDVPRLAELMARLNIVCILVLDKSDRKVIASAELRPGKPVEFIPDRLYGIAEKHAVPNLTTFSPVIEGPTGNNEILAVHDYGGTLAIARVETGYFVKLGKSVAFGEKGHAAIVDQDGNVLAHPLPDWVAARKNIAKVSAVRRMMAGETGIEQFYSPALKGDMIAGLTAVKGPGWGVMVPQPVSEIYDKVFWNNITILSVLGAGLTLTVIIVLIFMRSLVSPLEKMVERLKSNAKSRQLQRLPVQSGLIPIRELTDYEDSYNHMVEEVSQAQHKIRELAYTDVVTGLPNRVRFQELAEQRVAESIAEGKEGALVYIDLDDFKEINDLHGHDVGDDYLRLCAEKFLAASRNHATGRRARRKAARCDDPIVARIGGDEFVLVLPGIVANAEIRAVLSNLQKEIALLADEMGLNSNGSASIGCAVYPKDAQSVDELMKLADIAMYRAKLAGKNKSELYSAHIGRQTTAEIRHDILKAIENNELVLEYQPKIRTSDWCPNGAEALVRWDHPERGRLSPGIWLPAITETPIISRLGEWAVERAIRDYPVWAGENSDQRLAVNFGARHFGSPGFADWLGDVIRDTGFDSSRLVVEVTEDTLLACAEGAEETLTTLHERGFSVSIDDFGKGYSNIARLAEMPVDQIKIDRSLVVGACANERLLSILRCILDMARQLGCETVAEGIETLKQADFMTKNGVDMLQGYYFSKSLPPQELAEWYEKAKTNPVHERRRQLSLAVQGG